jgi:uncharacterized protein YbjQ (UPF0145 family)
VTLNIEKNMDNQFLITTTNSIEHFEIECYVEIISTNVVIGTNFFSDFGASLTDLFGGFSGTYQNKLQEIYNIAIDNLKKKAKRMGANAIIGLKIDFDEISGKGKSMFMISALGTAVVVKQKIENATRNTKGSVPDAAISFIDLNNEVRRLQIIEKIKNKALPSGDEWSYLLNNPIEEIACLLLERYVAINTKHIEEETETATNKLLFENFPIYIQNINKNHVIDILYDKVDGDFSLILEILRKNKLFDSGKIKQLIKKGRLACAIECLKIDKDVYVASDVNEMKEIITLLEGLPDIGKIEMSKGLLSKSTEVFLCPKGHKNNITDVFCQHHDSSYILDCQLNIKGVTETQIKEIDIFKLKVITLQKLLEN